MVLDLQSNNASFSHPCLGLDDMAKIYITIYILISVDTIYFRYQYEHY